MKWYYNHFPTSTSFLASGALITGEASPGYLPYPDVAHLASIRTATTINTDDKSGHTERPQRRGPRILAIGRDPMERAYSSYRYNYRHPTLEMMKKGEFKHITGTNDTDGKPDSYYDQFLFSFEEMIRAELKALRECLAAPNGDGIVGARGKWGKRPWAKPEYERRASEKLPPLVDLDGFCYGGIVNETVFRKQWAELVRDQPYKVITKKNIHVRTCTAFELKLRIG